MPALTDRPRAFTQQYCCGACWGELVAEFAEDGQYRIVCGECGEGTPGYVSRRYVERRIAENASQYITARYAMRQAYPFLFPAAKTAGNNLKELGF